MGALERRDKPLSGGDGRQGMWHCHEIAVTNKSTGDRLACGDIVARYTVVSG